MERHDINREQKSWSYDGIHSSVMAGTMWKGNGTAMRLNVNCSDWSGEYRNQKTGRVELHLTGLIGTASHPDTQKSRIIGFFLKQVTMAV